MRETVDDTGPPLHPDGSTSEERTGVVLGRVGGLWATLALHYEEGSVSRIPVDPDVELCR